MANTSFSKTTIEGARSDFRRQFHRGWVDAQNEERWANDYDQMNCHEQIAYEQGRLLIREAIAGGFALPGWRGDKVGAWMVDGLWAMVCMKIGNPVPPEWQEAA